MKTRIDYNYAHFTFDYTWLRDKQIIHKGDYTGGMLLIVNEDGVAVGMYAYELISEYENEKGLG
jgi:hypothetical protein